MPVADPDPTWSDWFANLFKSQPTSGAQPQPAGFSLNGMIPATPGVMAGPQPVLSDFQPPQPQQPQQGGYWLPAIAQGALSSLKSGLTLPGDVATGKISPADPNFTGRVADMAGVTTLGAGAAPAEPGALNMGIRAYHGSPYSFDRFDISKIGEGEGAQAYGHGLYFASNEDVAKSYRDSLSGGQWTYDDKLARERWPTSALEYLDRKVVNEQGMPAAFNEAIGRLQNSSKFYNDTYGESGSNLYDYAIARLQKMDPSKVKPAGSMYQVDINADPQHFLDWDKPFAEQSPLVQQAINKLWTDKGGTLEGRTTPPFTATRGGDTGENIHAAIATTYGDRDFGTEAEGAVAAAQALRDAGVPGIKYLDQGSRGAGTGSQNYVTFSDKMINIMRKYGISALGAAGAGDLMMGQPKPSAPEM